jgi:hypothetical protein
MVAGRGDRAGALGTWAADLGMPRPLASRTGSPVTRTATPSLKATDSEGRVLKVGDRVALNAYSHRYVGRVSWVGMFTVEVLFITAAGRREVRPRKSTNVTWTSEPMSGVRKPS